jgi:hypothetical protein
MSVICRFNCCISRRERLVNLGGHAGAEPFIFPEDARWNAERQAVEFGVEIGEYCGMVRGPMPAL